MFGFVSGKKLKACDAHTKTLMDKVTTVYDIGGYFLLEKSEDARLYKKRRELRSQGLDNLTTLETECDRDWKKERTA